MSVHIRRLGPEDAGAFRALRLRALADHPNFFGSTHADEAARDPSFFRDRIVGRQAGDAVFGAFAGDDLIGIAGMFRGEGEARCHRGTLWTVYVAPEHRGTVVAERIIGAVIDHARRHVDALVGLVSMENPRARAFYRRLGFEVSGVERMVLKIEGRHIDEEILFMDFTQGGASSPAP